MVQKLARQAGPLTKPMLLQQQSATVACRQIERIPVPHLARNAKPANQLLQAVNRLETRTIGARGTLKPVNFCKLRQRSVDFPQQHRGTRCGAAAPRIFTIDNDDVDPLSGQTLGHPRAGDAGTDDQRIAFEVLAELRASRML